MAIANDRVLRRIAPSHPYWVPMILCAVTLGGCAVAPPPSSATSRGEPVVVSFSKDELSTWSDVPMGVYRVRNSPVLVSGFEQGNALAIALGTVGGIGMYSAAMSMATDSSGGRAAVRSNEAALQFSLASQAQQTLRALLDNNSLSRKFTLTPTPAATVLKVEGDIVLQFFEKKDVRPFVVLRAKLMSPQGSLIWTSRYVASIGGPRAFDGNGSWTQDSSSALRATISDELQRALRVMLTDVSSPFARDKANKVAADGYFPFIRNRVQVVGLRLVDEADWFAFAPNMPATSLLAGVNIMDKSVASYRPATNDDPRLMVISAH